MKQAMNSINLNFKPLTANDGDVILFNHDNCLISAEVIDVFDEGVVVALSSPFGLFPWCVETENIIEVNPVNSRPHLN